MVPSKMVPSEGNPKNRQEEDQWDLDDGGRQHRAQHEHHKQQCAQGCCLPSWMTTDLGPELVKPAVGLVDPRLVCSGQRRCHGS